MAVIREHGKEQPYIPFGIFKLRLPFMHYKQEWPEFWQGLILVAVALGAIPILQETLGVPFELAVAMVALNGLLYILHPTFGDPLFPGWITPAIPLVLAFAGGYEAGIDRIHAIIALQLTMAVVFTFMGVTGLAKKIVNLVPVSMRAGIILGAGIAAVVGVIKPGGRMAGQEVTILVGAIICYLVLFSWRFQIAKSKNSFLGQLAKYGMLPGMIVAAVVGPIFGEIAIPTIEWGFVPFGNLTQVISGYTIFGAPGFPPLGYFIEVLPLVFAAYIIAFGDFVLAEVVTKDADEVRQDEVIDFNANRSNIISGLRNFIMALIAPYAPLCGPLWAGGTIAAVERYKHGRKSMDSIFGGVGTFVIAMAIAGFLMPIISLVKPVLPAALSLTLIVQGFACAYIAMEMVKGKEERGVAGIMAIFLAFRGAAWGLAAGVILHLLIGVKDQITAVPVAPPAENNKSIDA
ncbi:MAG: membrane protein [Peptococcaceae bacterium BICA1-8]|nr:MAG: membrane protein [Peptococcaceae bacterium BICA1-8]